MPARQCSRREWIRAGAMGLLVSASLPVRAQKDAKLPAARSLQEELQTAVSKGQVLVVMASLHGCAYCRVARASYLAPLWREGQTIVQVDMRSSAEVLDFAGQASTHDALIRHWKVTIAPTVLFFGTGGVEVAERMEGAYQPDFYGPYLEQRLEQGRKKL